MPEYTSEKQATTRIQSVFCLYGFYKTTKTASPEAAPVLEAFSFVERNFTRNSPKNDPHNRARLNDRGVGEGLV